MSPDKSTRKAVADDAGKWSVELDALPAGGPYELSIKSGDDAVTVRDILLGDVWLCSGQSNMQFTLSEAVGRHDDHMVPGEHVLDRRVGLEHPVGALGLFARGERRGGRVAEAVTQGEQGVAVLGRPDRRGWQR